jgi:tetratricopeptide (TPR) repeat protein
VTDEVPEADHSAPAHARVYGASRVNRVLLYAVLAAVILVLVLTGSLIYQVMGPRRAPRTAVEREIQQLEALASVETTNAQLWGDWATALIAVGQLNKADQVIRDGSAAMESPDELILARVRLLQARGEGRDALKMLDALISDLRKQIERKKKDAAEKGLRLSESVMVPTITVPVFILKGELLSGQDRPTEAATAYTEALRLDPNMADVLTLRGDAYAAADRPDEAEADYRAALLRIPGYTEAMAGLRRIGRAGSK